MKVVLYSKPDCPYCETAKTKLNQQNIQFFEFEFGRNADLNEFKEKYPEIRTVPAFFVDGVHIGGSNKLDAVIKMIGEANV